MNARTAAIAALALLTPRLAAQLPAADSAFARGDYRAARAAYEHVLASDSLNPRAMYRLAVLDSWDGKLAASLARFTVLRKQDPYDSDLMVAHARVLSWDEQYAAAITLYDSALAQDSRRADALAGRARTVAWRGDLDEAERLWRAALDQHPDDAEMLVGLAQTLYWKGRPELAESYVARARARAPEASDALELERQLRGVLRPETGGRVTWSEDTDDNVLWSLEARAGGPLGNPARRGTLTVDVGRATDPTGEGTTAGAIGSVTLPLGAAGTLRAGLGLEHLNPDVDSATTPLTAQLVATVRPDQWIRVGLGYSRAPLIETAVLIRRGFVLDALEAGADVLGSHTTVSITAGAGFLSDGNRRLHAIASAAFELPGAASVTLGPFARVLSWRETPGTGYFAPDLYTVLELRGAWTWQRHRWSVRLDAGAGGQQAAQGATWQSVWHATGVIAREWSAVNEIALTGGWTTAAATSATGAYGYGTMGLRARVGL